MDNKINIEDLKKQYLEAEKQFKILSEQLTKAQKEEEEAKKKKLEEKRDARQKEVQDALDNYHKLLREFIRDYGAIEIHNKSDYITPLSPFYDLKWWF